MKEIVQEKGNSRVYLVACLCVLLLIRRKKIVFTARALLRKWPYVFSFVVGNFGLGVTCLENRQYLTV